MSNVDLSDLKQLMKEGDVIGLGTFLINTENP